jgi:hypothetical protein
MNPFLNNTLHLSLAELIFFLIGALIVGFAIHFLWVNRKGGEEALKLQLKQKEKEADRWRLKFYDLEEAKERELSALSETIKTLEEKEENQAIEIEELSLLNQQLMLKNKNATALQSNYTQEIEANKNYIIQLESELTQLKSNHQNTKAIENINEGLSSWGAYKLRQELQKLTQQNNMLENQLNKTGKEQR